MSLVADKNPDAGKRENAAQRRRDVAGSRDVPGRRAVAGKQRPLTPERLAGYALWYLARRAASEGRLRRVLSNRITRALREDESLASNESAQAALHKAVADIVAEYCSMGVVNDAAWAASRVASGRRSGRSKRDLFARLSRDGIAPQLIEQAITSHADNGEDAEAADPELAAAIRCAQRRRIGMWRTRQAGAAGVTGDDEAGEGGGNSQYQPSSDEKRAMWRRDAAVLARAGFSQEIIRKVLANDCEPD